jgi:hypothetical protein
MSRLILFVILCLEIPFANATAQNPASRAYITN